MQKPKTIKLVEYRFNEFDIIVDGKNIGHAEFESFRSRFKVSIYRYPNPIVYWDRETMMAQFPRHLDLIMQGTRVPPDAGLFPDWEKELGKSLHETP